MRTGKRRSAPVISARGLPGIIDPERITFYSRRVMVIPSGKVRGMAVWRERLFAAMHLNANLPAAYFGVPTGQVVEMGLEVEI
jgi:KUP system potassium uptake protein